MAARPWVLPKEVKAYSEIEAVQTRSKPRLEVDIARAEQYVITYTHNRFEDCEEIPPPVKTAVILLAEAYASHANLMKTTSGGAFKSETFDDYAYSVGDSTFSDGVKDLDLAALLDDFVVAEPRKGVALRMRKL
mgnify:CR=1 FL=1